MIFVKDIEIVHIKEDTITVSNYGKLPDCTLVASLEEIKKGVEEITFDERLIKGRTFQLPNGKKLIIGWNTQVEDAIGFPMSIFNNLHNEIKDLKLSLSNMEMERNRLNRECTELLKKFRAIKGMSFFRRFKFLITGR
jgi:hypothetical protein